MKYHLFALLYTLFILYSASSQQTSLSTPEKLLLEARIDLEHGENEIALNKLLSVLTTPSIEQNEELLSSAYGIMGDALRKLRAVDLELYYLKLNYNLWKSKQRIDKLFFPTTALGFYYFSNLDFKTSARYYKEAFRYKDDLINSPGKDRENTLVHAYNNLGVAYRGLGIIDSAEFYFDSAYQLLTLKEHKINSDSVLLGTILGNIGNLKIEYLHQEEGWEMLEKDYEIAWKYGAYEEKLNTSVGLAKLCLQFKRNQRFEEILCHLESQDGFIKEDIYRVHLLTLQITRAYRQNNLEDVISYAEKAIQVSWNIQANSQSKHNQIQSELATNTINKIKIKLDNITLKNQLEFAKNKAFRTSMIYLLALIFMGLISVGFIVHGKIKSHKKKNEINKMKIDLLKFDLENKKLTILHQKSELSQFAVTIIEKNKFLRTVQKSLQTPEMATVTPKKVNLISQEIRHQLQIDSARKDFEIKAEKVHEDFLTKLTIRFPDLTKSEKRMCSLLIMDLSSKEIASLLNVSLAAVNKSRQRLRKKLNITSNRDLGDMLKQI